MLSFQCQHVAAPDVLCVVPGVEVLLDEEAAVVGGGNHSHATQDLQDSISAGNFPEWKLYIQV